MKKFFLMIIFLFSIILPVYADDINISSENAIVINLNDDTVLYEKNPDKQVPIASLTKIMTALVAIENINDLNSTVTITDEMLQGIYEYSKAGFKTGDIVTYEDLLYGVILPSGADAVQALALTLTNSNEEFAELMNKKAQELNLTNTHFSNGIGKDENNYSTVRDVSTLLKNALKNELFYKIYTTKTYTTTNGLNLVATINTHSIDTSLIKGSKTGFTDAAGLCITALYEDDTYHYIVVTTNAPYDTGQALHIIDANTLIKYFLDNYHYLNLYKKGDVVKNIPIKNGTKNNYEIKTKNNIQLYLPMNITEENLNIKINTIESLNHLNKKGNYLGNIKISDNTKEIYYEDFYLEETIKYKISNKTCSIIILISALILLMIYNILLRAKIHKILKRLKNR